MQATSSRSLNIYGSDCWFRLLGPCDYRGRQSDRAHLIQRQRLRNAGLSRGEQWDWRCWVWACRGHHLAFDEGRLPGQTACNVLATREDYPDPLVQFAREYGFGWFGVQDGWRRDLGAFP